MPDNLGGFDQILQAGWYLLELINEVLDLSMIEAGSVGQPLFTVMNTAPRGSALH